jgi:hypothetical protein
MVSDDDILAYLIKHLALDPGDLSPEDVRENQDGRGVESASTVGIGTVA